MQRHTGSFVATDDLGRRYQIDIWKEVLELPDGSEEYGITDLRCNNKPVSWKSQGVYLIKAGFSPTRQDIDLTSDDPNAP